MSGECPGPSQNQPAVVHGSRQPAAIRGSSSPAAVRGQHKPAVRGEIHAAVRGSLKPVGSEYGRPAGGEYGKPCGKPASRGSFQASASASTALSRARSSTAPSRARSSTVPSSASPSNALSCARSSRAPSSASPSNAVSCARASRAPSSGGPSKALCSVRVSRAPPNVRASRAPPSARSSPYFPQGFFLGGCSRGGGWGRGLGGSLGISPFCRAPAHLIWNIYPLFAAHSICPGSFHRSLSLLFTFHHRQTPAWLCLSFTMCSAATLTNILTLPLSSRGTLTKPTSGRSCRTFINMYPVQLED